MHGNKKIQGYTERDFLKEKHLKLKYFKHVRVKNLLNLSINFLMERSLNETNLLFKYYLNKPILLSSEPVNSFLFLSVLSGVKTVASVFDFNGAVGPEPEDYKTVISFTICEMQCLACNFRFVPLFINDQEDDIKIIAKWRMEIGK